jgi:hypothetical protein
MLFVVKLNKHSQLFRLLRIGNFRGTTYRGFNIVEQQQFKHTNNIQKQTIRLVPSIETQKNYLISVLNL